MTSSPFAEGERILILARADARARGASRAGLAHVAHVLRALHPDAFDSRFGYFGAYVVERLLQTSSASSGAALARSLVMEARDVEGLLDRLREELLLPEVLVRGAELADREQWILRHIEDRLRSYQLRRSDTVLDEIYVLVGTLKIMGFDSYAEMRRKLIAVKA